MIFKISLSMALSLLLSSCGSQSDNDIVNEKIDKDAIYIDENKELNLKLQENEDIVKYSLSGEDSFYFTFDEEAKIIEFKVAPDYEIKTIYKFEIVQTDKEGEVSTKKFTIRINDIDEDTTKTGYIADSGIEGLEYKTSSGIVGLTGDDGKYYFLDGDSVSFKLGNIKFGSEISATTKVITPLTLYGTDIKDYKNDTETLNILRFFQTLDSDGFHDNGIQIDSKVTSKFYDVDEIDFSDEKDINATLLKVGITENLVDIQIAKNNMDITLTKIDNNVISSNSERYKLFYDYSKNYFSLKLLELDSSSSKKLDFTKIYTQLVEQLKESSPTQEIIMQLLQQDKSDSISKENMINSMQTVATLLLNIYNSKDFKITEKQLQELKDSLGNEYNNVMKNLVASDSDKMVQSYFNEIGMLLKIASSLTNRVIGTDKLISQMGEALSEVTSSGKNIDTKAMIVLAKTFLNKYYESDANPQKIVTSINDEYKLQLDKSISFENIEEFNVVIDAIAQKYTNQENRTYDKILAYVENPLEKKLNKNEYDKTVILDEVLKFISLYNNYYESYQSSIVSQKSDFKYSTIVSQVTGKVWMDRNLGASRVCQDANDAECFGDYYQWGRGADGHQKKESSILSTLATTIIPNHELFIVSSQDDSYDWTSADKNGIQRVSSWNICPAGFRVPTLAEIRAEDIGDDKDAFSILKLPLSGYRFASGFLGYQNLIGNIWTANMNGNYSYRFYFSEDDTDIKKYGRAVGFPIRCIE